MRGVKAGVDCQCQLRGVRTWNGRALRRSSIRYSHCTIRSDPLSQLNIFIASDQYIIGRYRKLFRREGEATQRRGQWGSWGGSSRRLRRRPPCPCPPSYGRSSTRAPPSAERFGRRLSFLLQVIDCQDRSNHGNASPKEYHSLNLTETIFHEKGNAFSSF